MRNRSLLFISLFFIAQLSASDQLSLHPVRPLISPIPSQKNHLNKQQQLIQEKKEKLEEEKVALQWTLDDIATKPKTEKNERLILHYKVNLDEVKNQIAALSQSKITPANKKRSST